MKADAIPYEWVGLLPEQLEAAFPFHFIFNGDLRIEQVVRSLTRIFPELAVGVSVDGILESKPDGIIGPEALLGGLENQPVTLLHLLSGIVLRGQMIVSASESQVVFLGSPRFSSFAALKASGLVAADFAPHDSTYETLSAMAAGAVVSPESRRLGLVASQLSCPVIVATPSGSIEWVNDAFTKLTGYTLAEVRGKKPGPLLQGPETNPNTAKELREAVAKGLPHQFEILNYARDGRRYWGFHRTAPHS